MTKCPFLGGYGVGRSTNVEDSQLVNIYPEVVEGKDGKDLAAFYLCPGLTLLQSVGPGPINCMHYMGNDLYVSTGSAPGYLYKISSLGTVTNLGSTTLPIYQMIDNGTQLAGTNGAALWVWDGSTLAQATLPFSNPYVIAYQDGFGLAAQLGTNVIWQSNLFDLTTWDALNFSSADSTPTFINGLVSKQREVWILKSDCIEVWVNAGLSGFAFQRLQGVYIMEGCGAPFSVAQSVDAVLWMTANDQGQGRVEMRPE